MLFQMLHGAIILLILVSPAISEGSNSSPRGGEDVRAAAQPSNPDQSLIEARLRFVRAMYPLNDGDVSRLRSELQPLIAAHSQYMRNHAQAIRRRSKAITLILPRQSDMSQEMQNKISKQLAVEIDELLSQAPLSLTNVAKRVESRLSSDAVQRGRDKMTQRFSPQLKGQRFTIQAIDRLLDMPGTSPGISTAAKKTHPQSPGNPSTAKNRQQSPAAQTPDTPPRIPPSASSTPKPPTIKQIDTRNRMLPRNPGPPPPVNGWAKAVNTFMAVYDFTPIQKNTAEVLLKQYLQRAESYHQSQASAYQAAERVADQTQRSAQLKQLNKPLDKLYTELARRIDSVATVEQQKQAGAKLVGRQPAPVKPRPISQIKAKRKKAAAAIPPAPAPAKVSPPPAPKISPPTAAPKPKPPTKPAIAKPPAPNKPRLAPAPPMETWNQTLNEAVARYHLSKMQKKVANAVLDSCRNRAKAYLDRNKASYEKAQQLKSPVEKTKQLKLLNTRLDKLYNELTLRLDSVATTEQRQKADRQNKKKSDGK